MMMHNARTKTAQRMRSARICCACESDDEMTGRGFAKEREKRPSSIQTLNTQKKTLNSCVLFFCLSFSSLLLSSFCVFFLLLGLLLEKREREE